MECPSSDVASGDGDKRRYPAMVPACCPACAHVIAPGARFCSHCGAKLEGDDDAPLAPQWSAAPTEGGAAERRQLTVMICDLVGSTELSVRLDVEDYRDLIGAYCRRLRDVASQYGGIVAKYAGDGALVCFGYPEAHEDDAARATRAGLALVEAMKGFDPLPECALQVRIGIETGLVVAEQLSRGAGEEQPVVGAALNLAARLQALAAPDSVVISASTHALVGTLFECRDLGAIAVKGVSEPIRAWQALRATGVEDRFDALRATDTALVGRGEELALLARRWRQAKGGEGRVVLIGGEAGIGKSRIVRALEERISREPHTRMRWFCSPHHQDTALHPVVDQLGRAAGIERNDSGRQKLERLKALLAQSSSDTERDAALLADLLRIAADVPPHPSPQKRKEAVFGALLRHFAGLAARRPVLMVVEDVQWIDPTSQELLQQIVDRVQSLPVLLIVTFRPECRPPWIGLPQVTTLTFSRLSRRECMTMIAHLTRGKSLPDEVAEQIGERTDGVPLFVEEFTRTVMESGLLQERSGAYVLDKPLPPFAIPTTLRGSLLARLDQAPVREVLQAGAVIGREFSHELLESLALFAADELGAALDQLVAVGLVHRRGVPPQSSYIFKHCLVMDAAYDTLLRRRRRELHARIAHVLEGRSAGLWETRPELLAHHWAHAGFPGKAIGYWLKAAHEAMARSAVAEAVAQLRKALAMLAEVPETNEKYRQELDLQIALGGALMAARGYAVSETGAAFSRARQLCERVADRPHLLPITWGQYSSRFVGGEQKSAFVAAKELLELSIGMDDAGGRLMGHACIGASLVHLGALVPARRQFEQALAIDGVCERDLAFLYGQSGRVTALAYLSLGLLLLGFPEEARQRSEQSLREAEQLAYPPSVCFAYSVATRVAFINRDKRTAAAHAAVVTKLANAQGLRLWQALGNVYGGWAQIGAGALVDGIAAMRQGLTQYGETGSRLSLPLYLATLGSAYATAGDHAEALKTLSDALQASEAQEEHWITPDIHRRIAEVLLSSPQRDQAEAESQLRTAIALAQQQEARLWLLRSTATLARLLRDQGRLTDACADEGSVDGGLPSGVTALQLAEAVAKSA
jgi:class 3 adenylate cyclase/predicted ATPase/ABC-type transport system involved in cytochrome c biogenesis ATPase subunit